MAALAGAVMVPSGIPRASSAIERLMPIFPCPPGLFQPSPLRGRLGETPVHRHLRKLKADEAIVDLKADLPESLHHSELDPLIAPSRRSVLSEQDVSAILS